MTQAKNNLKLLTHQTELSANLVMFCQYLRKGGFTISTLEETEILRVLQIVPLKSENLFKQTLKSILVKNHYQFQEFDDLYQDFWSQLNKATNSKLKPKIEADRVSEDAVSKQRQFESLKSWLNLNESVEQKDIALYSSIQLLTKKDFTDLSKDEMQLIMTLLRRMAKKAVHKKSRLRKISKKRNRLDLKRTIQYNMRRGATVDRLIYSTKKDKKLKLVLLCDVSKSMELYSRFFTHLIYAFQNSYDKIETFVFSTALYRVTEFLNKLEFEQAFDTISERVPHWSGGTTIGNCLEQFVNEFAYSLLDRKTIVIIISDGWDSGDPIALGNAMRTIFKKSRRVIWLNPLAGNPAYKPEVAGLKAALPHVDVLCAAHNLDSLKKVLLEINKSRNLNKRPQFS